MTSHKQQKQLSTRSLLVAAVVLAACAANTATAQKVYPVAVFHGMGDACANAGMARFTESLGDQLGVYAACIESEAGVLSVFGVSLERQIENACDLLRHDPNLQGQDISVVGLSQGAIIARAIVEQCDFGGTVKRFLSIGGPQMGVATIPKCFKGVICNFINGVVDDLVYLPIIQSTIGPAAYFHNPKKPRRFVAGASVLPVLNNEREFNQTQKDRFEQLEVVQLTMFVKDSMVNPPSSAWFYFYAADGVTVQPYMETEFYKADLIGLKTLVEQQRVDFVALPGDHLRFTTADVTKYFVPALRGEVNNPRAPAIDF